jgi:5,5'-dehydrodivanillate O-demethylase
MEPFTQERIPHWTSPIKDPRTGRWITTHVMNQDFVAWVGQGTVADRTQEHLGESDRGVIMMRKKLVEQAELVARGGEPKGLVRDADLNQCVTLPIIDRDRFIAGYSLVDAEEGKVPPLYYAREFLFQAGQPEQIRQAYREAMGMDRLTQKAAAH